MTNTPNWTGKKNGREKWRENAKWAKGGMVENKVDPKWRQFIGSNRGRRSYNI
jgi:hypothetical protein